MDSAMAMHVGALVLGVMIGVVYALKQVAPLTENKVDDKIEEYGEKALPWMLRALDWFRSR